MSDNKLCFYVELGMSALGGWAFDGTSDCGALLLLPWTDGNVGLSRFHPHERTFRTVQHFGRCDHTKRTFAIGKPKMNRTTMSGSKQTSESAARLSSPSLPTTAMAKHKTARPAINHRARRWMTSTAATSFNASSAATRTV